MAPIEFRRAKGIVWVCDLAKSSSYLNSNELVDSIEEYIPRLYFVSKLIVESYGGQFLKWTGDGFLAFFEISLDRHKISIANKVYEAIWHLTFLSNITQLGLNPEKKFKIRHGVTYEKDALLMKIKDESNRESIDIIGRAVVLAFRLSGVESYFPSIVTTSELIHPSNTNFKKWKPNKEGKLKYFKGEEFGIESIFVSCEKQQVNKNTNIIAIKDEIKETLFKTNSKASLDSQHPIVIFLNKMNSGPIWCQEIIDKEIGFIKNDLIGSLQSFIKSIEKK